MPWQSGITGIGWNPNLTGGHPVTSMEQLFSGDLPGKVAGSATTTPKGLQFSTPTDGGLIWTDNMVIPFGADHPVDAITRMTTFTTRRSPR